MQGSFDITQAHKSYPEPAVVTVPAGHFTALRYFNLIDFRYPNTTGRNAGQRKENIWFAPEIGRWVVRESSGTFRQDVAEEFNESSYRWELLSWT